MKKYIVAFIGSEWYCLNLDDNTDLNTSFVFSIKDCLITFQVSDLIRKFNSQDKKAIPSIIDLESLEKQFSQKGKEFNISKNWKILQCLRRHNIIDKEFTLRKDNIIQFMEHIASLYKLLIDKDDDEKTRYNNIEILTNRVIHDAQLRGIRVDTEVAKNRCQELERQVYDIKNILQLEHNIFSPDVYEVQKDYLKKNNYSVFESLLYSFKIRRKTDEVCNLFYELIRNQQDLDSLLYISSDWAGKKRTNPVYVGFGTITSRIILRQPCLQNLRKTNRDIIIPDDYMKLLYIDYSQFEAGILASLSDDESMIDLYNTDIYSDLAEKILENKDQRQESKILFYRFMYGDQTLDNKTKNYFSRFKKLQEFKINLEKEINANNKIGINNGNFRISLSDQDNSWALSHKVQALASLIYKTAVNRTYKEIKEAQFLIPMHDGTVYQIKTSVYDDIKEEIETIYKDVFKSFCPKIEPKVNTKELFN